MSFESVSSQSVISLANDRSRDEKEERILIGRARYIITYCTAISCFNGKPAMRGLRVVQVQVTVQDVRNATKSDDKTEVTRASPTIYDAVRYSIAVRPTGLAPSKDDV